jgi:hypothetical protein
MMYFSDGTLQTRRRNRPANPIKPLPSSQNPAGTGLAGMQPQIAAFVDQYLQGSAEYDGALATYMAARGVPAGDAVTRDARLARFRALSFAEQLPLIEQIFFAELRASGRYAAQSDPAANGDFSRGFAAIEALFPGSNPNLEAGETNPYDGSIKLYFSQIYTLAGGDIHLLAPGGQINVGLASPPLAFGIEKEASQLGIVTRGGGNIDAFSFSDLLVNEARVFATGASDVLIWSTRGDVDAGRGAKTARSAAAPSIVVEPSGRIRVVYMQSLDGSGILAPGDMDLFAPRGVVNAGDAGIVAGNLTIAATAVLGADNIKVSGVAVGVPVDAGGLGASLSGVSSSASSAANSATATVEPTQAEQAPEPLADAALTWLDVFVTGFGDDSCTAQDANGNAVPDANCVERQNQKKDAP